MKVVLGSKSLRRSELLNLLDLDFYVDYVDLDEDVESYTDPKDYAMQVVKQKGKAVSNKHQDELVICADTIVVVDEVILGKPVNKEDARRMMNLLNNRSHEVMTAVYIKYLDYEEVFVEVTKVYVDKMTSEEIESYISSDEPYDKSGGYGIQGRFSKHIKKVEGDFFNVMGLPVNKVYNQVKKLINKH